MADNATLKGALLQLAAGNATDAEREIVQRALQDDQITVATGERAVALGGNATDAVIVTGDGNVVYVFKGGDTEIHRDIIRLISMHNLAQYLQPSFCNFYTQIRLPEKYVERSEVLAKVRTMLLSGALARTITSLGESKVIALHGMGGIGKTSIARVLCDDTDVQAAFPDGILWASLGQEPNLVSAMRDWVIELGGTISENLPSVERLKSTLAKLLKERACLLILDNIWQHAHAEALLVGGPRCCTLLTTREAGIILELGAMMQPIALMTENEAIQLLENWADGHLTEAPAEVKSRIVKQLGYLPLALKLAGGRLLDISIEKWQQSFEELRDLDANFEADNPEDSLYVSFNMSLNALKERVRKLYIALGIFRESEAIPEQAIEKLWYEMDGVRPKDVTRILRDLTNKALMERQGQHQRTVVLHDLLHRFVQEQLGAQKPQMHRVFLNAYRNTKTEGWHTIQDDGYLYDHVTYHLHAAGAIDELKGLFVDQQWMHKRVPQCDYIYDGYLHDLTLAWQCADAEARSQIEAGQEPTLFADCIRYLLIRTSINSIAGNYVPELVARAVEVEVWTPKRALSVAAKISDETHRAWMYIALLRTASLSEKQQREAQRLALEAVLVLSIDGLVEETKEEALTALIPYLTEKLLEQVVKAVPRLSFGLQRVKVLAALALRITGTQRIKILEQGVETTLSMAQWHKAETTEALAILAPHLTEVLLERALEAALALEWVEQLWGDLYRTHKRAEALAILAPYLTGRLLERSLEAALALSDAWERVLALTALAPYLTGKLLERGLEAALALQVAWDRVKALTALLPKLAEQAQWIETLEQEVEMALDLSDKWLPAEVLTALAPYLTRELLERALEAALALSDGLNQAKALAALAPYLTGEQRIEALELGVEGVLVPRENWETRVEVLVLLVPQLSGELLERVVERVLTLSSEEWEGPGVLETLAPYLTGKLLERVAGAAFALAKEEKKARILAALAPQFTGAMVKKGLKAAVALQDRWTQAELLAALGPRLSGELLERGLEAAVALQDGWLQSGVLMALTPYLTKEQLKRRTELVLPLMGRWEQANILTTLAPYLTREQLEQEVEKALAPSDYDWGEGPGEIEKVLALAGLIPHLPEEKRIEVLERGIEMALSEVVDGAKILEMLAPYLIGELLERGVEVALAMPFNSERAKALAALVPQLPEEKRIEVLERGVEAALQPDEWERYEEDQWGRCVEEMNTLYDWLRVEELTKMAPYLTGGLFERVVEVALVHPDEWKRAMLVTALAPKLTGELLVRVLETFQVGWHRVEAVAALAPYLTGEQRIKALEQGVEAALQPKEWDTSNKLATLIPHLTGEQRNKALERGVEAALKQQDASKRVEKLAMYLPLVSHQTQLLQDIRRTIIDYSLSTQYSSRSDILNSSLFKKAFTPPIFSPETLRAFASQIFEICEEWHWL